MNDIAIRVESISKRYRIGQHVRYKAIREVLGQVACTPLRLVRQAFSGGRTGNIPAEDPYIWALQDVSFDVQQGEVVGIIGRNGAGKSTLLKILSRITKPTAGRVEIFGRVGSLLEVGTGFHPELTGSENIYLNGAILGMRRAEIERKFDEIAAFAEIEKFLETPVKRYSSGMYMRLAFSVAAHLEPEILVVDEVLAVGDAQFQKKCLGKMNEVSKQGRTVLFVSHQMNAITTLCNRCVWLNDGSIMLDDHPNKVVSAYLNANISMNAWTQEETTSRLINPFFTPTKFCLVNKDLSPVNRELEAKEGFGVLIEGISEQYHPSLTIGFSISAMSGELLFWSLHTDQAETLWAPIQRGVNRLVAWIPGHLLNEGDYRIELIISLHFKEWISQPNLNAPAIFLQVRGGLSESPLWIMARPGLLAPIIIFENIS